MAILQYPSEANDIVEMENSHQIFIYTSNIEVTGLIGVLDVGGE